MRMLMAIALVAACVATTAAAARDALTGVWVAHDTAGDQSTDRFIFSGPNADGVRSFTLVDSYGSFCEVNGEDGTGSVLTGSGSATLVGTTVYTTIDAYVCANGQHGTFDPPLTGQATLTADGLDDGYYVAVRVPS
jgi:hypothetical protein